MVMETKKDPPLKRKSAHVKRNNRRSSNFFVIESYFPASEIDFRSRGPEFNYSGGSMISGKGVHMYKGVGVRFADFFSFF